MRVISASQPCGMFTGFLSALRMRLAVAAAKKPTIRVVL
jgi:hypothetical protein